MRIKRINQIESYILENKSVSLDQICDKFEISKNTARRDLNALAERNSVKKVYGGAMAIKNGPLPGGQLKTFEERNVSNAAAKQKIATTAARFVQENDTIYIDSGTTTSRIIDDIIKELNNVTIITNSIPILFKALSYPKLNVIAIPGKVKGRTASLVGFESCELLKSYNISKAFMACTALSLNSGVTTGTYEECEIKKIALERSGTKYLLVDNSKFDKTSLVTYASLENFDCIITEKPLPQEYTVFAEKHNVKIISAE